MSLWLKNNFLVGACRKQCEQGKPLSEDFFRVANGSYTSPHRVRVFRRAVLQF
jgi:hypothetical protein